jgi:hypothetical protein
MNPAADGAKLDRKGIKYSGERGVKSFFNKRRENIERVNNKMGYMSSGSDNGDDDGSFQEIKGGQSNKKGKDSLQDSRRDSEVSLPAIKGYKLD